ncbi:DUF2637 domain-containing protein [Streptomyces actinomycinicus]|uniref:DUF2637 domain-containing protein n=1 Tax=Streptomyces actinomycinicus TaxID=1695166 RepID=A0A937JNN4_9ACTN|nr:DUF2637 domain-containing protein [Streptomyces actinomycinicus]MBL1081628.1 DUF2637 domain-containing protein [Streptomyces actinomycinicus]
MHPEYLEYYPDPPVEYPGGYPGGEGRHRAPAEAFYPPLTPPDSAWDPAEELAFMLRDTIEQQAKIPSARTEDDLASPNVKSHRDALVEITSELPPVQAPPRGHRKVRKRQQADVIHIASYSVAAMVTVIASAVSIFGGLIAYDPLRFVAATRTHSTTVSWWPLLVFGPWLVASLSILRASLHQRRAFHSWSVLLVFSAIAMTLCVAQAPRNIVDTAAAALPSFASLACFQQVVRQITLTRPPRRTLPRHRGRPAEAPADGANSGRPWNGTPSASGPQDRARVV